MSDTPFTQKKHNVFLDANILISTPYGNPLLERLKELSEENIITILTTDQTMLEVAGYKIRKEYERLECLSSKKMMGKASYYLEITIPEISSKTIHNRITEKELSQVTKIFKSLKAEILDIDVIKPSSVLSAYAHRKGMFQGGKQGGKKDQFPDAFIFECLKARASGDTPIIIVSDDNDFHHPYCEDTANITCVKTIDEALMALQLKLNKDTKKLNIFIQSKITFELVNEELNEIRFELNDSHDIANIETTEIAVSEVTNFGKGKSGVHLLVGCHLDIKVDVTFVHPIWATALCDSENNVHEPWDAKLSTHCGIELETISASLLISVDGDDEPKKITDLKFTNFDYTKCCKILDNI